MSRRQIHVLLVALTIPAVLLTGCRKPKGPQTNFAHLRPLTEPKVERRRAPGADLEHFTTYGVLALEDPGSAVGSKLLSALVTANLELAGYRVCDEEAEAVVGVIATPSVQQSYRPPRTIWLSQWQGARTSTVTTSTGQTAWVHEPGRYVSKPVSVAGRTTSYRWLHLYLSVTDLSVYRSHLSQEGTDPDGLALAEATLWECVASARVGNAPAYAAALPLLCTGLVTLFEATGGERPRGVGRLDGLTFAYALTKRDELVPLVAAVKAGSAGERAGFRAEDVIVVIDDTVADSLTPTACRAMLMTPKDPPRTITVKRLEELIVLSLLPRR